MTYPYKQIIAIYPQWEKRILISANPELWHGGTHLAAFIFPSISSEMYAYSIFICVIVFTPTVNNKQRCWGGGSGGGLSRMHVYSFSAECRCFLCCGAIIRRVSWGQKGEKVRGSPWSHLCTTELQLPATLSPITPTWFTSVSKESWQSASKGHKYG